MLKDSADLRQQVQVATALATRIEESAEATIKNLDAFRSWCDGYDIAQLRIVKIILTVAHLDHTPENCDSSNLKALCQRCHNNYDGHHHRASMLATARQTPRSPVSPSRRGM